MQHSEIIKILRSELGLTQKDFAEKFNLKRQQLSDIERGKTKISAETILLIVQKLNLNPTWLLTGEGQMLYSPDYPLSSDLSDKIKKIVHELPLKRQKMILNYAEDQQNLSKLFNE
ncbi:helix-turn-helix transcriptional regulator [bacterium]|nr:helix-turn-helix transcriptional regulator [bacterium]